MAEQSAIDITGGIPSGPAGAHTVPTLVPIRDNQVLQLARAVAVLGARTVAQSPAVNLATDDPQIGTKVTSITALETGGSGLIGWLSQIWRGITNLGTTASAAYTDATGAAAGDAIALLKGLYVKALDATGVAVTPKPSAAANGATVSRVNSAASNNLTNLKASAGTIIGIDVFNVAAYDVFLKLYNKATAPVVASDTPVWTIPIKGGTGFSREFTFGRSFPTGIGYAIVKLQADTDATNVAALDLTGSIAWI